MCFRSVLLFLLAPLLMASSYGHYEAQIIRVIDGDTIKLSVFIWPGLKQQINLRLLGINTPEKRGRVSACEKQAAILASEFTRQRLKPGDRVVISEIRLGKYAGRVLGRISKNGKDMAELLLEAGHARTYAGGKRQPWCGQGNP